MIKLDCWEFDARVPGYDIDLGDFEDSIALIERFSDEPDNIPVIMEFLEKLDGKTGVYIEIMPLTFTVYEPNVYFDKSIWQYVEDEPIEVYGTWYVQVRAMYYGEER